MTTSSIRLHSFLVLALACWGGCDSSEDSKRLAKVIEETELLRKMVASLESRVSELDRSNKQLTSYIDQKLVPFVTNLRDRFQGVEKIAVSTIAIEDRCSCCGGRGEIPVDEDCGYLGRTPSILATLDMATRLDAKAGKMKSCRECNGTGVAPSTIEMKRINRDYQQQLKAIEGLNLPRNR